MFTRFDCRRAEKQWGRVHTRVKTERMGIVEVCGMPGKRRSQGGGGRTHSEEEGGDDTKLCEVIHRRANYNSFQKGKLS